MGRPKRSEAEATRVGEVIRARMSAQELTVSELARRAGFDVSQMHKIAHGKCGTDLQGYIAIAGALGWSPAEFFARVVRRSARSSTREFPNR